LNKNKQKDWRRSRKKKSKQPDRNWLKSNRRRNYKESLIKGSDCRNNWCRNSWRRKKLRRKDWHLKLSWRSREWRNLCSCRGRNTRPRWKSKEKSWNSWINSERRRKLNKRGWLWRMKKLCCLRLRKRKMRWLLV